MSPERRTFLLSGNRKDVSCTLDDAGLTWGEPPRRLGYAELAYVRLYNMLGAAYAGSVFTPPNQGCTIRPSNGRALRVFARRYNVERGSDYQAFTAELLRRLAAYPNVAIYTGYSLVLWLFVLCMSVVVWGGFLFFVMMTIGALVYLFQGDRSVGLFIFVAASAIGAVFAGRSSLALWRTLRDQRPRRRN